jgi:hypothetical protein
VKRDATIWREEGLHEQTGAEQMATEERWLAKLLNTGIVFLTSYEVRQIIRTMGGGLKGTLETINRLNREVQEYMSKTRGRMMTLEQELESGSDSRAESESGFEHCDNEYWRIWKRFLPLRKLKKGWTGRSGCRDCCRRQCACCTWC